MSDQRAQRTRDARGRFAPEGEPRRIISVRLPASAYARLCALAAHHGISKTEVIIRAIMYF